MTQKYTNIVDDEQRALTIVVDAKNETINALVQAAEARKARGADTFGIEQSIDYEQTVLAGYVRALDVRIKQLRAKAAAV